MKKEKKEVWTEKYVLWHIGKKIRCLKRILNFFLFLNLLISPKLFKIFGAVWMFRDVHRWRKTRLKRVQWYSSYSTELLCPAPCPRRLHYSSNPHYQCLSLLQWSYLYPVPSHPSPNFSYTHTHTYTHSHTHSLKYYSYILNFPI